MLKLFVWSRIIVPHRIYLLEQMSLLKTITAERARIFGLTAETVKK